jgi:hypothetical protein
MADPLPKDSRDATRPRAHAVNDLDSIGSDKAKIYLLLYVSIAGVPWARGSKSEARCCHQLKLSGQNAEDLSLLSRKQFAATTLL